MGWYWSWGFAAAILRFFLLPNLEKVRGLRFFLILVKELVGEIIKVGRKKSLDLWREYLKKLSDQKSNHDQEKFHPNFKNKGPIFWKCTQYLKNSPKSSFLVPHPQNMIRVKDLAFLDYFFKKSPNHSPFIICHRHWTSRSKTSVFYYLDWAHPTIQPLWKACNYVKVAPSTTLLMVFNFLVTLVKH